MTVELDVVIPVRDVDRYLGEALASVRHQEGVACSVIVVDAGSATPIGLPSPFQGDPTVRLVRSETPLTTGGGRNRGVPEGSAPWIGFLDADDLWPPASRRALIDEAQRLDADIAVGKMRNFHSDTASQKLGGVEGIHRANMAGGIVVSRRFWDRIGQFDPDLQVGEFVEWWLRAQKGGARIVTVEHLVLERRLHLESTTVRLMQDRNDYLRVVRQWMNRTG